MDLEVLLLIYKSLGSGDDEECEQAAEKVRLAIEKRIQSHRYDYLGQKHQDNLNNLLAKHPNINHESLKNMLVELKLTKDVSVPPKFSLDTLLGSGQYSLLRSKDSLQLNQVEHSINTLLIKKHFGPKDHCVNVLKSLQARKLRGPVSIKKTIPAELYTRYKLCRKIMGHLSSVYCVCFDQTGQYIFTGADDHLIKIWSALDGRLLKTLRGHDGEITDMSVNYENRLLASGGMDKIIRIWDLKTSKLLECLNAHNATITSVRFAPYNRHANNRYLVSTSNDGSVVFWQYDLDKFSFKKHRRYQERTRPGGQIVCCSFSPGGSFLACGSSDNCIHIYGFHPQYGPGWLNEIDYHKDQVDSIQFSNQGLRFITGSQDGTAAIWSFKNKKWEPLVLNMLTRLDQTIERDGHPKRVLIVQWSQDDRYVMTSTVDYKIRVWDSKDGRLLHILDEHKHDVYLLESHPIDPRILISASHDGTMIIWDIERAKVIRKHNNECADTHIFPQIYDLKISPDGNMIVTTDSYGYLSLYGNGGKEPYSQIPDQLFFNTDYRPLIRDMRNFVFDEDTQLAPHLMANELVDMNGNPYPRSLQRLVIDYRTGDKPVVAPLTDVQLKRMSDNLIERSEKEDLLFLLENKQIRGPSSATTEELTDDDQTVIDSDATEIDDAPANVQRPIERAIRTRSSAWVYMPATARQSSSTRPQQQQPSSSHHTRQQQQSTSSSRLQQSTSSRMQQSTFSTRQSMSTSSTRQSTSTRQTISTRQSTSTRHSTSLRNEPTRRSSARLRNNKRIRRS